MRFFLRGLLLLLTGKIGDRGSMAFQRGQFAVRRAAPISIPCGDVDCMLDKESMISRTVCYSQDMCSDVYQRLEPDQKACEIWKKYATGNSEQQLLELALSNDGLCLADVTCGVRVTNLACALERPENRWIADAQAIVGAYQRTNVTEHLLSLPKSAAEICLLPFVDFMLESLLPATERFAGIAARSARIQLAGLVMSRLVFCAEDALLTCARYFGNTYDLPDWRKVPLSEKGRRFVAWFYESGIELLVNTYPELIRKLLLLLEIHRKNCLEFLENFEKDIPDIAAAFAMQPDGMAIASVAGSLSDAHNGGKSALKLGLQSGENLFYKPRSMAVDCAWNQFADKLTQSGFPARLGVPQVLDRGSYGYVREIVPGQPLGEDGIREYYRNAGGLCCVVSLLGGSDFHHENIIAQGTVPVLVDIETIMTPKPAPLYGLAQVNRAEGASTHVGRTLMLQQWVGNSASSSRDIGGFTSEQEDMQNIPVARDGSRRGAEYFPREFAAGFAAAYDFFVEHRQQMLRERWLEVFAGCRFRYVFRRTALYYSLMKHFYSAPFLRDTKYFEGALSRLGAGILLNFEREDTKRLWKLVAAEKQSMRLADIPYFTCCGSSRDLSCTAGVCVENFFEASPVELAEKNLCGMSGQAKEKELAYIRLDLETCRGQKSHGAGTPILSYQEIVRHPRPAGPGWEGELLAEVDRIMEIIGSFELDKGSFIYYAPVRNRKNTRYNLEVLPAGIYSGTLGVLIAQAAYAVQKGDAGLRAAVLEKMRTLYEEEFHTGRGCATLNIGFAQGIAGYLQTAMLLADILQEKCLLEMALSVAVAVPQEHILRTEEWDFFGGLAGALYYFSKLFRRMPHPGLGDRIRLLRQQLCSCGAAYKGWENLWSSVGEYQPLTGLAHGQCGAALALLEAQQAMGEENMEKTVRELFRYEDACYSPKDNNWFDFRKFEVNLRDYSPGSAYKPRFMYGYCSGAPGIGVARIAAAKQLQVRNFDRDIERAADFCMAPGIIGNDSLCCGSGAWIELLLEASLYTGKGEYRQHAQAICRGILPAVSGREYLLSNLQGTADISLFKGYSGIVYQMLRTMDPLRFPSALL